MQQAPAQFRPEASGFSAAVEVRVHPASEWPRLEPLWARLAERLQASAFMTPLWVSTWLEVYAETLEPLILVFHSAGFEVGICLVPRRRASLRQPLRRLALNAAGEPAEETTYVEYNDLLCEPGWAPAVALALYNWSQTQTWDEITFDGFQDGAGLSAVRSAFASLPASQSVRTSRYVDLQAAREQGADYVATLSPRNREQLRRKIRYQERAGALTLERAATAGQACEMLQELAAMNRQRMSGLERVEVFAAPRFLEFHQRFLTRAIALGKAEMFRLRAAGETVGTIYNLVERDRVYFYQCGYRYTADKRLSPGTVTLAHVIQHELERGRAEFDFLAGEEPYKHWMSNAGRNLTWLAIRRPNARVRLYDLARRLRNRLARRRDGATEA